MVLVAVLLGILVKDPRLVIAAHQADGVAHLHCTVVAIVNRSTAHVACHLGHQATALYLCLQMLHAEEVPGIPARVLLLEIVAQQVDGVDLLQIIAEMGAKVDLDHVPTPDHHR
jgi:hypothetical protein